MPLAPAAKVPRVRRWTPLYDGPRIAQKLGLRSVCVKDDGANPTGSLKDRASALVLARALELGISTVSTASTGNAAAALAVWALPPPRSTSSYSCPPARQRPRSRNCWSMALRCF